MEYKLIAVAHVNGFVVPDVGVFLPREVGLASVRGKLRTVLVNDNDFQPCENLLVCGGSKLKSPFVTDFKINSNDKKNDRQIVNLMHLSRNIRSFLRESSIGKNIRPFVGVCGPQQKQYFESILSSSRKGDRYEFIDLYSVTDDVDDLHFVKSFIETHYVEPDFHRNVHVDDDVEGCSTRIAWIYSNIVSGYGIP